MEEAPGPTQTLTTNHQIAKKTLEKQCLLLRQTPSAQNKALPSWPAAVLAFSDIPNFSELQAASLSVRQGRQN
jgi:hypothetical protein